MELRGLRRAHNVGLFSVILSLLFIRCQPDKLFAPVSSDQSNVSFVNEFVETEDLNINQYLYAHNGGGVAVGDINNDGLPDIYFTANQSSKKLFLNKGNFEFEDITERAGVAGLTGPDCWTTGVVMVDINHDGFLDIYVSQVSNYRFFTGKNQLYINNGDLTFSEKAEEYNLDFECYSQQAAFFDYDLDGDLDLYLLSHSVHNPQSYGKADIRTKRDTLSGDRLLRNDGGKFFDVSEQAGIYGSFIGYGLAIAIGDIDNNGSPDIFISNDFHENDYVYYNNCDGTFREDIKGTFGHTSTFSMGNDMADINNDGWLDIMSVDMKPEDEIVRKKSAGTDPLDIFNYKLSYGYFYQYPRNMLQVNRGNLFGNDVQFSEIGQLAGMDATDWSWTALMADLDNDGWKDIFITNGILRRPIDLDYINYTYNEEVSKNMSSLEKAFKMPNGAVHNYMYRNLGTLQFENVSSAWGLDSAGYSMGAAYADLDNDGDLDVIVNNLNSPATLYRNNSNEINHHNFIKVKLLGSDHNTFGVGATITVETENTMITQVVNPTRGWLSSMDLVQTIGVGKASGIKSTRVQWPDGRVQEIFNPAINTTITIRQGDAIQGGKSSESAGKLFENVTEHSGIDFIHHENGYNEFSSEPLIPHLLSTEGPALAVADINHDGLDDFYIGGAAGQPGVVYYQVVGDSTYFKRYSGNVFELDSDKEDVDAVFFDADQDGDLDLYVVSGGGELRYGTQNRDRLYTNDKGQFENASDRLPKLNANGSCVVAGDFNADGLDDLFVGTRSVIGKYGISPDSYVLWNTGKSNFKLDTTAYSDVIKSFGMVTDAVWLKESKELAVVGEWMPVTFLSFQKDKIVKRELPESSGWWNAIHAADLDQDGDTDLLLGNFGSNSNIKASVDQPVRLYVKDFDSNFMTEPMLTYYRQDKEWLFASLDEIKKQMPSIRYKYNDYTSFAMSPFQEVFAKGDIESSVQKSAQTFYSGYLINEGKGNYTFHAFSQEMQFSPVFAIETDDFNGDGFPDILSGGNFYGCAPSIGRFDASYGSFLLGSNERIFSPIEPRQSGFAVFGEVRNIKKLRSSRGTLILVARNNTSPRLFSVKAPASKSLSFK